MALTLLRFLQLHLVSVLLSSFQPEKMPHKEDSNGSISITELHPTFAAEVRGVDFSQDISPEVFKEIHGAITKVSKMP